MKDCVIVGGGISGLAAAHRLLELNPSLRMLVLESSERVGGLIQTECFEDFLIEHGPDSLLRDKPEALHLATRLGLEDQIIGTNQEHRGVYVVQNSQLVRAPEGFSLLSPTRVWPFVTTPLLSWQGKLRALAEPWVVKRVNAEESIQSFVSRRFGVELWAKLAEPLIAGIYGGDPNRLAMAATLPRFMRLEEKYGSVMRGLRQDEQSALSAAHGVRYGLFVSFKKGMQTLTDALSERLGNRVRLKSAVDHLEFVEAQGWKVLLSSGETIFAKSVVAALPALHAKNLFEVWNPRLAEVLGSINYRSMVAVTLAYKREQVLHPMDAFGLVVPTQEGLPLVAATWSSVKYAQRAPDDHVLMRVFLGGHQHQALASADEAELVSLAESQMQKLMAVQGGARFFRVHRYLNAMPQYEIGHQTKMQALHRLLQAWPSLALVGNAYEGVGIADSVRSGEQAAERVLKSLSS